MDNKHQIEASGSNPPPLPCGNKCAEHNLMAYQLDEIKKGLTDMSEKLDKIYKAMFVSNGTPSIVGRLHDIEVELKEQSERQNKSTANNWALWIAISAALIGAIAPKAGAIFTAIAKVFS